MHKISFSIFHTTMVAKALTAFAALGVLFLFSCSSEGTIEDVEEIKDDIPMRFSSSSVAADITQTRASSTLLEDGFKVSCWKKFGDATNQQIVMDGYKVAYNASAANKWYYENVDGQFLKYWDLSAYPYEFRAVTPYLNATNNTATITDNGVSIDLTASEAVYFKSQTYSEGSLSQDLANSEPCKVAHVTRMADGSGNYKDFDCIANADINTTNTTNPTREVSLPFHHLMSKVGFRFYVDDPEVPAYAITLSNVEISIVNATSGETVTTASKSYTATNDQGLIKGTFGNLVTTTDSYKLLTQTSDYSENMGTHLNTATAFNLLLDNDDLLQIPQSNFKIHVKLTLSHNGNTTDYDADIYNGEGTSDNDKIFSWEPNTHYIYYLHLKNLEKYPIILCTAEIVPWDVVKTEDIEIGL